MKKTVFQGVATALITPLDENGVNYEKLGELIKNEENSWQAYGFAVDNEGAKEIYDE